ncbi:MAG: oligosaccharide flippase family protein [Gaiellaceae bacterium]
MFGAAMATYGTHVAVSVLSLVSVLIVARVLGASGRGEVAFLITIATLSSQFALLGIPDANGNLASARPELRPQLATNSLFFAAIFGVGAAAIVGALADLIPGLTGELDRELVWIALAAIPLGIARWCLNLLVQADYAFMATNRAWLAGPLTTVVANGVMALLGELTVTTAIAAWVGGQALSVAILVGYVALHAGFGRPSFAVGREAVSFGAKAYVGRTLAVGNTRADQWIVGSIAGSNELGLYSVAVAWAEVIHYLPGVLVMVQRPDLVRLSREKAGQFAARIFRVAIFLGLALTVALVVAAPILCVTIFGEEFRGSIDDLRVLALSSVGVAAVFLLGNALIAQRKPLHASAAEASALVASIALNLVLVPIYGGLGAAIAAALAFTIGGATVSVVFSKMLRVPLRDLLPRGDEIPWLWRKAREYVGLARG